MTAPVLLLLNGAPGSGKSTLAARRPLALALDVDQLKHSLAGWEEDPQRSRPGASPARSPAGSSDRRDGAPRRAALRASARQVPVAW
ncbi:ATP-binding protein [Brachybacterium paraconglomeratum]|uniref:ATP-binding protein n=1 Tax=Brachybacterium paraconglomeratum TaxID=173362 RepID=UPI0021A7FB6A|nr:ATP-binding protein [Brachybacterium paraconglomeratum]MCT1910641.1 ATP-binding protein [Brachybacterium paraconglomeratum]